MKKSKVKFYMHGHHNSEFRDVTYSFTDKGSLEANYAQALKLAIRKEAQWTGWYDNELLGLEKQVGEAIDKMIADKSDDVIINGFDDDGETEPKISKHVGLVVWFEKGKQSSINAGFGMAYNRERKVSLNDSSKYDNRWVSLK